MNVPLAKIRGTKFREDLVERSFAGRRGSRCAALDDRLANAIKLFPRELPTGVIMGSAVIEKVTPGEMGTKGMFHRHLADVQRVNNFRKPGEVIRSRCGLVPSDSAAAQIRQSLVTPDRISCKDVDTHFLHARTSARVSAFT